jgi:Zn-dependent protease with chaperone function
MISALRKISQKPQVQLKNDSIASLFIENPLSNMSTLFQTHPSIEDRIKALQNY